MPRGKLQGQMYPLPQLQPLAPSVRQQCCVICYRSFTPFEFNSPLWDSNMIKNFYTSLDISTESLGLDLGEDGEEDGEIIIALPFCPQCHTKVSVMTAYQTELQNMKSKCNSIRNDIAFTVVETISQNSRDGPIDHIRQQIYDKWKKTYEENLSKSDQKIGLEHLASDPAAVPHNCGNFVCICHEDTPGNGYRKFVVRNGRQNGFEYETLEFSGRRNANIPSQMSPGSLKKQGIPKMKRPKLNIENPPLLSPHKPLYHTIRGGFRGTGRSKPVSESMIQKRSQLIGPPKAHVQRLNFSRGKSTLSPSIRKSSAYSHVKAKVASHFVHGMKDKSSLQTPNVSKLANTEAAVGAPFEEANGTNVKTQQNPVDAFSGKRKQPETETEHEEPSKILKQSSSPTKVESEQEQEPNSSPRSTRMSPRSPTKSIDDVVPSGKGARVFKCPRCPKEYSSKSKLLRHESMIHPESKSYQCDVDECRKGFSSKEAFKRHLVNVHKLVAASIQTLKCRIPKCRKTFLKPATLELHMNQFHKIQQEGTVADAESVEQEPAIDRGKEMGELVIAEVNEEADKIVGVENGLGLSPEKEGMELMDFSTKPKRRITANRLFGVRRRKRQRGSASKKKRSNPTSEDGTPKRKRKRVAVTVEVPVRKSSRQRGVQLDSGKPMYPQVEPKLKLPKNEGEHDIVEKKCGTVVTDTPPVDIPEDPVSDQGQRLGPDAMNKQEKAEGKSEKRQRPPVADKKNPLPVLNESVILGEDNSGPSLITTLNTTPGTNFGDPITTSTPMPKLLENPSEEESTLVGNTQAESTLNTTYTVDGSEEGKSSE